MSEYEQSNNILQLNLMVQAVGIMSTIKPTMPIDVNHPVEMALEVVEYVNALQARITALEIENAALDRIEELQSTNREMKAQLDIATDLGEKRFRECERLQGVADRNGQAAQTALDAALKAEARVNELDKALEVVYGYIAREAAGPGYYHTETLIGYMTMIEEARMK